jgi:UrcA family protein
MYTKIIVTTVRTVLGGATVAWALCAASAVAGDRDVTVAIQVSANGLDVRRGSDAQELYTRIRRAADRACTRADRIGLVPVSNEKECIESALGNAVRSANLPQLTQVYLGNHTLREAAARGIETPVQLAKK